MFLGCRVRRKIFSRVQVPEQRFSIIQVPKKAIFANGRAQISILCVDLKAQIMKYYPFTYLNPKSMWNNGLLGYF